METMETFIERFRQLSQEFADKLLDTVPEIRTVAIAIDWNVSPETAKTLPAGTTKSRLPTPFSICSAITANSCMTTALSSALAASVKVVKPEEKHEPTDS